MNKSIALGIDWEKIVYVKESVLMLDAVALRHQRTYKIIDDKYSVEGQSYLYLGGDIFYSKEEIKSYADLVKNNLDKLDSLVSAVHKLADRFAKVVSIFDKKSLEKNSNMELTDHLNKFCLDYQNVLSTLYIPIALDENLSDIMLKYLNSRKVNNPVSVFNHLTSISKENDMVKYHNELTKIALVKTDEKSTDRRLKNLAQKYSYLGIKFFLGEPWSTSVAKNHLQEILRGNSKKELQENKKIRQAQKINYQKAIAKLNPDNLTLKIIQGLREAIYLRTYRLERISEGEYNSLTLFAEIGKRLEVGRQDLRYFRFREISDALASKFKITPEMIGERKLPIGMFSAFGKTGFYFGDDYNSFKLQFQDFKSEKSQEVRGQVAFQGIVVGKVVLIEKDEDLGKIKPGEILVTKMTTPDYIFAMKKAGAIVTDLGGVTSHASVISRELAKPCIVGTKIATKVFKDGDLVEVDADKGIVRKIDN